jgi:hypothetical protein
VKSSLNILTAYCDEKNLPFVEVEQMSVWLVWENQTFLRFFAEAKRRIILKKKSMVSIRYQLQLKCTRAYKQFYNLEKKKFLAKNTKFIEFWKLLMYLTINMLQVFHVFKCKIKIFFYQGWLIYHARYMVCHKKNNLC